MQTKKIKKNKSFFEKNIYLKTYLLGLGLSFFFVPFFAYAATTYSQDLFGLFEYLKDIIDDIVLWLFTTGGITFLMYKIIFKRNINPYKWVCRVFVFL
jgi:hypothetical protein